MAVTGTVALQVRVRWQSRCLSARARTWTRRVRVGPADSAAGLAVTSLPPRTRTRVTRTASEVRVTTGAGPGGRHCVTVTAARRRRRRARQPGGCQCRVQPVPRCDLSPAAGLSRVEVTVKLPDRAAPAAPGIIKLPPRPAGPGRPGPEQRPEPPPPPGRGGGIVTVTLNHSHCN